MEGVVGGRCLGDRPRCCRNDGRIPCRCNIISLNCNTILFWSSSDDRTSATRTASLSLSLARAHQPRQHTHIARRTRSEGFLCNSHPLLTQKTKRHFFLRVRSFFRSFFLRGLGTPYEYKRAFPTSSRLLLCDFSFHLGCSDLPTALQPRSLPRELQQPLRDFCRRHLETD